MPGINVSLKNGVGHVTISNPTKFNAMTPDMWQELPRCVAELDADSSVRVIVLVGDGDKAFVSGADISGFATDRAGAEAQSRYSALVSAAYRAPASASKPVIAQIRGICMGGGLGLALGCDIRICSDDARFRMPAARLGLGYSDADLRRFVALIGTQNTYDIFYTARTFDAQDALRMGYVLRVVPAAALASEVDALAAGIAKNAPLTLRAVKLSVNGALKDIEEDPTAPEAQAAIDACNQSRDCQEGARAFLEKRAPQFQGH